MLSKCPIKIKDKNAFKQNSIPAKFSLITILNNVVRNICFCSNFTQGKYSQSWWQCKENFAFSAILKIENEIGVQNQNFQQNNRWTSFSSWKLTVFIPWFISLSLRLGIPWTSYYTTVPPLLYYVPGVAIMLSITIFATIVGEMLPVSDSTPLIGWLADRQI